MASLTLDNYTVAWICALPLEAAVARVMLDKTHSPPQQLTHLNAYKFGELNGHHIVIAYLPNGVYGTVSAAAVVSRMRLTFPQLQFGLMVGIGGGVPSKSNDIRLGDVVVSKPSGKARHWMVSLPRNPKFVSRQDEITKLEELLAMQDGPRRVVIAGLGGIGKTQVAIELVYRIRDQDKKCSVFWLPCTSHAIIEQAFLNIAETLGLHDTKPAEVKEQIKTYLSSECAGKWLLVFDNADDTEMWLAANDTAPALEDMLFQSEQGRILFTTRNRKLAMKLALFNIISIPDIDKDTAIQILGKTLADKDLLKINITAASLLEQLAYLPLAITQASAYVVENSISLSDYLALLQEQEQDAVDLSEDFRDPGRYKEI
ncbi:P-loop containing nucleoside triphosphate hydrolase protein [Aspergillus tamarii]|uniref:P-loop containing nucleoside triphosphate hydrolase protein n=1 Tax=Aspergillus tamarii TaxID=41984 RepID=A0A5N6UPC3_ASPTM|nr:P-loop containing nucleoside triphosphate hydrolase protein [Aspergillus tamarii]